MLLLQSSWPPACAALRPQIVLYCTTVLANGVRRRVPNLGGCDAASSKTLYASTLMVTFAEPPKTVRPPARGRRLPAVQRGRAPSRAVAPCLQAQRGVGLCDPPSCCCWLRCCCCGCVGVLVETAAWLPGGQLLPEGGRPGQWSYNHEPQAGPLTLPKRRLPEAAVPGAAVQCRAHGGCMHVHGTSAGEGAVVSSLPMGRGFLLPHSGIRKRSCLTRLRQQRASSRLCIILLMSALTAFDAVAELQQRGARAAHQQRRCVGPQV